MQKTDISETPPTAEEVSVSTDAPENRLLVYYLHGNVRCQTCESLERLSEKAVITNYTDNINNGSLEWKVVNYDEKENEHFLNNFDVSFQSLVVVDIQNNQQIAFENLDKIWELVHDEDAYLAYVKTTIDKHLSKVI